MDFKSLSSKGGTMFNRMVQVVTENVTNTEVTQLDKEVVESMNRSIQINKISERLLSSMNALLHPNPALRAEKLIRDVLQTKTENPPNYLDALGETFNNLGVQYDPDSSIGQTMVLIGKNEQALGLAEQRFVKQVTTAYCEPFSKFLDNNCKEAALARETLENCRIDYDAARRSVKQAITAASKQSSKDNEELKQRELEHQSQVTKEICDKLNQDFQNMIPVFKGFVQAQYEYLEAAHLQTKELNQNLKDI